MQTKKLCLRFLYLLCVLIIPFPTATGQTILPIEMKFLKENSVKITNERLPGDQTKWEKVSESIGNKRFVSIGEYSHGAREVFLLRNELIRHLHSQHSYDVILFEAGMGELILPDLKKEELSPAQLTYGFFGIWRTSEFRELMKYIKTENIAIAGYDVQSSGQSFSPILDNLITKAKIDSSEYGTLEKHYTNFTTTLTARNTTYSDSLRLETSKMIESYNKLYHKLLAGKLPASTKGLSLALKTLQNRAEYLEYMLQFKKDNDWSRRWSARDSLMADNISWLAENIYPGKKIIIVGHNFHVAKHNVKEKVMGEFLKKNYPGEIYSVATYARRGTYLDNSGRQIEMKLPDTMGLDIKHLIGALGPGINFVHIPTVPTSGDGWLRKKITINDSFVDLSNSNKLVLSESYDGLLLLDEISPPVK